MSAFSNLSREEQVNLIGLLLKGGDQLRRWVAINRAKDLELLLQRLRSIPIAHVPEVAAPVPPTELARLHAVAEVSLHEAPELVEEEVEIHPSGIPPLAADADGGAE